MAESWQRAGTELKEVLKEVKEVKDEIIAAVNSLNEVEEKLKTADVNQAKELDYLRSRELSLRQNLAGLRMMLAGLQQEKNRLAEALDRSITAEQGQGDTAAGVTAEQGQGATAAGGAPAPRQLVDDAAELHQLTDDSIWELHYRDKVVLYMDAVGVVGRIRSWAKTAMKAAVNKNRTRAPSLLLISGLIKTGKSFTLEHVVPVVVAEALRKQGEKGPLAGMVLLCLNADQLSRQEGATVMLRSLLNTLLDWARKGHVPMGEGALQAAEDTLARPFYTNEPGMPGQAILEFLKEVKVPVLVLCDEVQSLFLPTIGGKLDVSGADYVRDSFMKTLLLYGPHTMLWCLTGSSMAQTWVSLANMPSNGYYVLSSARNSAVSLPATYSSEHMSLAWKQLQGLSPDEPLDPKLLELCPPSIALLAVLVEAWVDELRPSDVAAFVRGFMRNKLIDESLKEWKLSLEGMPPSQRIAVLDLSFPGVGTRIDTDLHSGLRSFLEPHLDRMADGRYYLRDMHQRQILRLLFNKDGTIRDSWSDLEFSATLTQLDGGWILFRLGEAADYLLGLGASRRWEGREWPAGMTMFEAKMQAIAKNVASKLELAAGGGASSPHELWEQQPWFMHVLESQWNSSDRAAYERDKQARGTHLAMLVFYLRLSRNVLAHMKVWDLAYDVVVDVSVIEALPSVLGLSVFDFTGLLVEVMRELSHPTVEEAIATYEVPGGGSSSKVEGSRSDASDGLSSSTDASGRGRSGKRKHGRGGGPRHNTRAVAGTCALVPPGPVAGCGQRTPLVYTTDSRRRVWGQGRLRAAMPAPRLLQATVWSQSLGCW